MADVLVVAAGELCDPVALFVFVVTDDGLLHWFVLIGVVVFWLIVENGGSCRAAQVGIRVSFISTMDGTKSTYFFLAGVIVGSINTGGSRLAAHSLLWGDSGEERNRG